MKLLVKIMTRNYEKGDILQMIEHIDSMKNSNNDRVQEIYEEVDSYTIDILILKKWSGCLQMNVRLGFMASWARTITVNLAGSQNMNWFSARWSIKLSAFHSMMIHLQYTI